MKRVRPPLLDEAEGFLRRYNTPSRWNWLGLLVLIIAGPDLIARLTEQLRDKDVK